MKEIKYRALDAVTKKWVYGYYVVLDSGFEMVECIWQLGAERATPIDPDTLGQLTGLTDVNGREIYEGDIVRQYSRSGYEHIIVNGGIGVLEYSCGAFVIRNINDGRTHFLFYSEQEVIGNVHQNTDLLKENEE